MRRDTFLKSLAALAAAGTLPLDVLAAAANYKMMIPANPGGGWDTTGRALGKAMQDAGVASSVTYENKGGAAGAIGLAQFVNASKGDPHALMVMGAVMLGGIITGKPPVSLTQATPIARLTTDMYLSDLQPAMKPSDAYARIAHRETDRVEIDLLEGRVTTSLLTPYPPGIPLLIPGERFNKKIVDYLRFTREFNKAFPGFDTDVHGLVGEDMPNGEKRYYVDCVRD